MFDAPRPARAFALWSRHPLAILAAAAVCLAGSARIATAYCDLDFGARIGPPAMAQPDGTFQTITGDCSGSAGCGDFFDIDLQAGDTLSLSFCSNGGSAAFDTDLSVRYAPGLATRPVCATDECGLQSEAVYIADETATYRVRIGHGELFDPLPDGHYTLAYSAPNGRLIAPSSCGNGTLDAGEQCDDGNDDDGDCCTRGCTYEAAASECLDEGNDCTDNVCDGAGTCTHPNKGVGVFCDDGEGFFCTVDTCDGAGTCTHELIPGCNMLSDCAAPLPPGFANFPHPAKALKLETALVQAFVGCNTLGGNTPNTTTETGTVPACYPAETGNEDDGSPTTGWHWGPSSKGQVTFFTRCKYAGDVGIKFSMSGITDGNGALVDGDGTFEIAARLTVMDPVGGPMTTFDIPVSFPFHVAHGAAKALTSLDAMLTAQSLPPLPNGVVFELAAISPYDGGILDIRDANGNSFARPGVYLP